MLDAWDTECWRVPVSIIHSVFKIWGCVAITHLFTNRIDCVWMITRLAVSPNSALLVTLKPLSPWCSSDELLTPVSRLASVFSKALLHPCFWHQSPESFTAVNSFPSDVLFIIFLLTFPLLRLSSLNHFFVYFCCPFVFSAIFVWPDSGLANFSSKDVYQYSWVCVLYWVIHANLIQISLWHIITFLLN